MRIHVVANTKFLQNIISITFLSLIATTVSVQSLDITGWHALGDAELKAALEQQPVTGRARNVILFVGDGMGISTVTAARIYAGQVEGGPGEDHKLSFETLPYLGLAKTYNTNQQTPDSAGTMTAMMTGRKTLAGVIALDQGVTRAQCSSASGRELKTLLEVAEDSGLATGIISTARITHATPAATYAHTPERDWEYDMVMPDSARADGCRDIARQLVEFTAGDGPEFVLGGGRSHFLPLGSNDPEYPDSTGKRGDGRDLVAEWQQRYPDGRYVWNHAQFEAIDPALTGRVLGLFQPSHMQFEVDRAGDRGGEPSLSEMTAMAIRFLSAKADGYFLMIESGRIDHAHHAGNAYRALDETRELAKAVTVAMENTDREETLIIVTADHSHVFTIAGYPVRGNPILGKVIHNDEHGRPKREPELAADGKPYTTLGYMNGPGFAVNAGDTGRQTRSADNSRHDLADIDTTDPGYHQEAFIPTYSLQEDGTHEYSETHGGEDVAIYADGPWAHLFHRTHEQSYIYYVMRHALGLVEQD